MHINKDKHNASDTTRTLMKLGKYLSFSQEAGKSDKKKDRKAGHNELDDDRPEEEKPMAAIRRFCLLLWGHRRCMWAGP